LIISYIPVFQ
jgi:dual specificity tyrosine-phosphorylation-regulated kinase 1